MKRVAWFLVALWAILSVAVLARLIYDGPADSEIRVRFAYEVLAVNFPLSVTLLYFFPEHPVWQWFLCTLVGFVQWVLIVPWLIASCRRVLRPWYKGRRSATGAQGSGTEL